MIRTKKFEKTERHNFMKRGSAVLLIFLIMCSFISCNTENERSAPSLKVDDIVNAFEDNVYSSQPYNSQQIAEVKERLSQMQLSLTGEVVSVIHIVNKNTAEPNLEWTYVYEFSNESDAALIEENRREFVSNIANGISVRFDNIVVFGNSPVISELGK